MTAETSINASDLLIAAADAISERAHLRDQPNGERSMARTVAAFTALTGVPLTELQGWQFMALLKLARSNGGALHVDDYTDGAAYIALAGECAATAAPTSNVFADVDAQDSLDWGKQFEIAAQHPQAFSRELRHGRFVDAPPHRRHHGASPSSTRLADPNAGGPNE